MVTLTNDTTSTPEPNASGRPDLASSTSVNLGSLLAAIAEELSRRSDPAAKAALADGVAEVGRAIGRSWAWQPGSAQQNWTANGAAADWTTTDWSTNDWTTDDWTTEDWTTTDWTEREPATHQSTPSYERQLTMFAIREAKPGAQWKGLLDATWPAYRAWYLSEGETRRPKINVCADMLAKHMPELVPTWKKMVELGGGDELVARFLTGWDLPQFAPGCSQAVLTGERPILVRNYDYNADLWERVVLSTQFSDHKVIGTSDCLWGLLDGMNDAGLMVSLAFGGRPGSGEGFAVPMVVRYVLETCATVQQAKDKLDGIPMAMAYNLTIADAHGETITAYVAPDAAPEYRPLPAATNHRGQTPEYPDHARQLRSVERHELLLQSIDEGIDREELADSFMAEPLRAENFTGGFGTLYTAIYRPDQKSVEYRWPDSAFIRTFDESSAQADFVLRSTDSADVA